jgi:hypothetical protein
MDPATLALYNSQHLAATQWLGQYVVPNIEQDGALVPVAKDIKLTNDFQGLDVILIQCGNGELTFYGGKKPNELVETKIYRRLACPCGRTDGTVLAKPKPEVDEEELQSEAPISEKPVSQKSKDHRKGAASVKKIYNSKTCRMVGCQARINCVWKDTVQWDTQVELRKKHVVTADLPAYKRQVQERERQRER